MLKMTTEYKGRQGVMIAIPENSIIKPAKYDESPPPTRAARMIVPIPITR